jgi:hypothetical protein
MTPYESQVLQTFLTQLTEAHAAAKDPEAEAMISEAVARQPAAAYLLVQRALLLQRALQQAKSELARLQEQRDRVGGRSTWTQASASTTGTTSAPASPPQAPAPPQAAGPNSGRGGFLGNAATTAAGVAGGAFLFQGLEGLFGHNAGGGGFLGESTPTETVENIENLTVNDYSGDAEAAPSASAIGSDVNDHSDEAEPSGFDSADDADGGFNGNFDDTSSWT